MCSMCIAYFPGVNVGVCSCVVCVLLMCGLCIAHVWFVHCSCVVCVLLMCSLCIAHVEFVYCSCVVVCVLLVKDVPQKIPTVGLELTNRLNCKKKICYSVKKMEESFNQIQMTPLQQIKTKGITPKCPKSTLACLLQSLT